MLGRLERSQAARRREKEEEENRERIEEEKAFTNRHGGEWKRRRRISFSPIPPPFFSPTASNGFPKKTFPPSLVLSLLCCSLPSSVNRREEEDWDLFPRGCEKHFFFSSVTARRAFDLQLDLFSGRKKSFSLHPKKSEKSLKIPRQCTKQSIRRRKLQPYSKM